MSSLASALAQSSHELLVAIPKNNSIGASCEFKLLPILPYGLYDDPLSEKRTASEFKGAFCDRREAARTSLNALTNSLQASDVLLLSTPMAAEFSAFVDWYSSLRSRPAALIHLVLPPQFYLDPLLPWQELEARQQYLEAANRLTIFSRGRHLLLCNDNSLAKFFKRSNAFVIVHKIPMRVLPPNPEHYGRIELGLIGTVRPEKGLLLALQTVDQIQRHRIAHKIRWTIQTAPAQLEHRYLKTLSAPNIGHVAHVPDNHEYQQSLSRLSVIILPYEPSLYRNCQSSHIFYEALASGIPTICSETGFFLKELSSRGATHMIFRPYTPNALAEKIIEVVDQYNSIRAFFSQFIYMPDQDLDRLIQICLSFSRDPNKPGSSFV